MILKYFWMSGPPLLAHALTSVSLLVLYQWRHYKIRRACEQSGKWRSPKKLLWRERLEGMSRTTQRGSGINRQISWSFCLLQKWSFKLRDLRKPMVPHLALITFLHLFTLIGGGFFLLQTNLQLDESTNDFFGSLGSTPKKWPGEFLARFFHNEMVFVPRALLFVDAHKALGVVIRWKYWWRCDGQRWNQRESNQRE